MKVGRSHRGSQKRSGGKKKVKKTSEKKRRDCFLSSVSRQVITAALDKFIDRAMEGSVGSAQ
jgi:hypothetical protein